MADQQQGVGAAVGGAAAAVGGAAAAAAGTAGAATATAGMGGAQTPATGAATAGAAAAAGGGAAAGAAGAAAGAGAGAGTVNGIPIQQPEAVQKVAPSSVQQPPDGVNQGAAQDQGSVTKEHVQAYKRQERLREEEARNAAQLLPKAKLLELVQQVDPNQTLDAEVEELLLDMTNDFIERVVTFSCQLAKHRGSDTLEAKDVQLHLERNWNIRVPTSGRDEVRTAKPQRASDSHKNRMAAVQKDVDQVAKKRKLDA